MKFKNINQTLIVADEHAAQFMAGLEAMAEVDLVEGKKDPGSINMLRTWRGKKKEAEIRDRKMQQEWLRRKLA